MLILMNYKSYSSKSNQPADGSVHWVDVARPIDRPILDTQFGLMFGCGSCLVFLYLCLMQRINQLASTYMYNHIIYILYVYIYICRDTHKEPRLITKTHRCIIFRCFHPPFPAAQVAQTVVVDARGRGRRCSDNR